MPITNFSELKTAIIETAADDLVTDAKAVDFISFFEAEVNYGRGDLIPPLRVLAMQQLKESILTQGDAFIALPDDFLEMRSITETTNSNSPDLEYLTPSEFTQKQRQGPWERIKYFTIDGGQIRLLDPPVKTGQTLEMSYYGSLPTLNDNMTTNWMLQKHPQFYLYGSLVHAEAYLTNDARIATWSGMADAARAGIIARDKRAQSTRGARRMRPPASVAVF